jgi:lipopolysaccharide export system permease protein
MDVCQGEQAMTIVQRHYLREFFKVLVVLILGLSMIMALFDLVDKLDDMMKFGPKTPDLFRYWLYTVPKYIKYLLPMSILFSTLLVLGQAARHRELIAIKSAGGSLHALFFPFVAAAVVFFAADFAFDEFVASPSTLKADNVYHRILKDRERVTFKGGEVWFMENRELIVNAESYLPDVGYMNNLILFRFRDGKLAGMIKAAEGRRKGKKWTLSGVTSYDLEKPSARTLLKLELDEFKSLNLYDEERLKTGELSFVELYAYYRELTAAGYNNVRVLVDMHSHLSYPFTCIFTMLTGLAISARYRMGGGLLNIGIAVAICLVYWLLYSMTVSLGYSGILPAAVAAWITPLGLGLGAVYFYWTIPQ